MKSKKVEINQNWTPYAKYINDLHAIGFDEDEIDSMLKEVNIARMSEHVIGGLEISFRKMF